MCTSWLTLHEIPNLHELFDLDKREPVVGWLGKPLSEARFLAAKAPDQLNGMGNPMRPEILIDAPSRPSVQASQAGTYATAEFTEEGVLEITPSKEREVFGFVLSNVPYTSDEVYVEVTMRSTGKGAVAPKGYNRALVVSANQQQKRFMVQRSVVTEEWATHRFYFANTYDYMTRTKLVYNPKGEQRFNLRFMMQDTDSSVEIKKITVHSASEIVERTFEHGVVVANLSNKPYTYEPCNTVVPAKDAVFIRTSNNNSK